MRTEVVPPLPSSALVVDLRGFTAELTRTHGLPDQRRRYCEMLAAMNAAVVECAWLASAPARRGAFERLVHVASTGDGALLVFLDPGTHHRTAFLAALLLRADLARICEGYRRSLGPDAAVIDFGMGLESGHVSGVGAYPTSGRGVALATWIGGCINAAARVQALTKDVHRTDVLLCTGIVEDLTGDLLGQDYAALMAASTVPAGSIDDESYLELETRMIELNRSLCVQFLHHHLLRGFDAPIALFRLSKSSAVLGNPRFDALLARLAEGDASWLAELRDRLRGHAA